MCSDSHVNISWRVNDKGNKTTWSRSIPRVTAPQETPGLGGGNSSGSSDDGVAIGGVIVTVTGVGGGGDVSVCVSGGGDGSVGDHMFLSSSGSSEFGCLFS